MTSHDARLAQILLAPSQHSNYFALTAILEYDLAKQSNEQVSRVAKTADHPAKLPAYHCCPRLAFPAFQPAGCHSCLWRKTTCVANTDVSKKISKCQQLKTWSLQKNTPALLYLNRSSIYMLGQCKWGSNSNVLKSNQSCMCPWTCPIFLWCSIMSSNM